MLFKVILSFESEHEIFNCDHSNERTEQYLPAVLFVMQYKVVLTFD